MTRTPITLERLKQLFIYQPEQGVFIRRLGVQGIAAGIIAGSYSRAGWVISVDYKRYQAGRLAWFYMTGAWPQTLIHHKDHNPHNNRWCNLREATRAQVAYNRKTRDDNSFGLKGVSRTGSGNYAASIKANGVRRHLGSFRTPEAAHAAYCAAAVRLHGEFANTGAS